MNINVYIVYNNVYIVVNTKGNHVCVVRLFMLSLIQVIYIIHSGYG